MKFVENSNEIKEMYKLKFIYVYITYLFHQKIHQFAKLGFVYIKANTKNDVLFTIFDYFAFMCNLSAHFDFDG